MSVLGEVLREAGGGGFRLAVVPTDQVEQLPLNRHLNCKSLRNRSNDFWIFIPFPCSGNLLRNDLRLLCLDKSQSIMPFYRRINNGWF